jgi:transcriptional regulator GlxA family with amidase domain
MTRSIDFFIFDGVQILDLAGPLAAFDIANRLGATVPYRLRVVAADAGPVRSSSGAILLAEAADAARRADTLIVAGGIGTLTLMREPALLDVIRRRAEPARRVCSVCSGAFFLAAAGLLDGRPATTHWRYASLMAAEFPSVRVSPDRIHLRDDKCWTSAGVTAGIDLALALIADDLGEAMSREVAQEMVVYHRRAGGQSQYSNLIDVERPASRFSQLLAWMRENLDQDLGVERLAEQAAMSTRNFSRAFRSEMGATPAKVVERLRIESARVRVETTDLPFARIAEQSGFGDADRMRRAFIRAFGHPPQALRRIAA